MINEPFASGVIYPAVLAAWTFLALVSTSLENSTSLANAQWGAVRVFIVGFAVSLIFSFLLKHEEKIRKWVKNIHIREWVKKTST